MQELKKNNNRIYTDFSVNLKCILFKELFFKICFIVRCKISKPDGFNYSSDSKNSNLTSSYIKIKQPIFKITPSFDIIVLGPILTC